MKWYLQACPVCGGDLHDDIEDRGWVTCFLCARSFPFTSALDRESLRSRALTRSSSMTDHDGHAFATRGEERTAA